MDPLSQVTIGAVAAQATKPSRFLAATLAGAVGGLLPDADVLIRSSADPLLFLDFHRHFTHALAFVPIGGALAAVLCCLLSRGRVAFREMFLPATIGWATHGLLDACTSYGTYLYWPFSNERVAWHLISIVDPLFTLPLVVGMIWAVRRRSARIARAFLLLALAYIGLCAFQLDRAEGVYRQVLLDRGHDVQAIEVKPSIGNNVLFRAFYAKGGVYHVDAVRVPWVGPSKVYPGSQHPMLDLDRYVEQHDLSALHQDDIERFRYFSADHLIEDPRHEGVLSDFRYAMVPSDIAPLWGVDVLGTPDDQHLSWLQLRDPNPRSRALFVDMLFGR